MLGKFYFFKKKKYENFLFVKCGLFISSQFATSASRVCSFMFRHESSCIPLSTQTNSFRMEYANSAKVPNIFITCRYCKRV